MIWWIKKNFGLHWSRSGWHRFIHNLILAALIVIAAALAIETIVEANGQRDIAYLQYSSAQQEKVKLEDALVNCLNGGFVASYKERKGYIVKTKLIGCEPFEIGA